MWAFRFIKSNSKGPLNGQLCVIVTKIYAPQTKILEGLTKDEIHIFD